jgi:hypothetical protein
MDTRQMETRTHKRAVKDRPTAYWCSEWSVVCLKQAFQSNVAT